MNEKKSRKTLQSNITRETIDKIIEEIKQYSGKLRKMKDKPSKNNFIPYLLSAIGILFTLGLFSTLLFLMIIGTTAPLISLILVLILSPILLPALICLKFLYD